MCKLLVGRALALRVPSVQDLTEPAHGVRLRAQRRRGNLAIDCEGALLANYREILGSCRLFQLSLHFPEAHSAGRESQRRNDLQRQQRLGVQRKAHHDHEPLHVVGYTHEHHFQGPDCERNGRRFERNQNNGGDRNMS